MLGLVAYGGSSDEDSSDENQIEPHISDEDEDLVQSTSNNITKSFTRLDDTISDNLENIQVSSSSNVFTHLPAPVSHNLNPITYSITSGITKSKGQSGVKITIPSLDEFDDVEEEINEPKKTKIKASLKGSGLFSLLPKPRNEFLATPRQLITDKLTNKNNIQKPSTSSLIPRQITNKKKPSLAVNKSNFIENDSGESDEDDSHNNEGADFFTIPDKVERQEQIVLDKNIEEYMKPLVTDKIIDKNKRDTDMVAKIEPRVQITADIVQPVYVSDNFVDTSSYTPCTDGPIELNDEVIRKLGGRKRKGEDLKLIEVDGRSLVTDSKEWLTKQLSQETTYKPSCKKNDGPTSQQKRKHQITYLAFQAKANELDLKNQWANNRQSKRQTQSKYGF